MDHNLLLSKHIGTPLLRPLGALEEVFWLLDQHRPMHFVTAAEVSGPTTVGDWRRAYDGFPTSGLSR